MARRQAESNREQEGVRALAGSLLILAAAGLAEVLARFAGPEHPLQRVSMVPVVAAGIYAAAMWGRRAGLLSAALGAVYLVSFFLRFGTREGLPERLSLGLAIAASAFVLAALVGHLRTHADQAAEQRMEAQQARAREAEEARRTVEAKAADLVELNRALSQSNEALEAFSYVVSHDLKEPVRALSALTTALEEDHREDLPEEGRVMLRQAREASRRLSSLVAGLLEVSRADRADLTTLGPVSIREAVESDQCKARYRDLVAERGARLVVSEEQGTPPVLATRPALAQILGNLIVNAIRHNQKVAPMVVVHAAPAAGGDAVEVSVEDDGPGFSEDSLTRVSAILRGEQTPRSAGGFGLLIVHRTVDRLGGSMAIRKSETLGGAAVRLTLPSANVAPAESTRPHSQGSPLRDAESPS